MSVTCLEETRDEADPLALHILSLTKERQLAVLADLDPELLEQARRRPVAAEAESAEPAAPPQQRRRSERRRTLKAGRVLYNNLLASADCDIREFSDNGCRIRLVNPMAAPDRFVLELVGDGSRREVRAVWRSATEIGLAFL